MNALRLRHNMWGIMSMSMRPKAWLTQQTRTGKTPTRLIDCWVCHGVGIGVFNLSYAKQGGSHDSSLGAQPSERLACVTPNPPDRPQWSVLA